MPDDIAAAAARLAEDVHLGFMRGYPETRADLAVLLPVLDAVAAGRDDEGRVERWKALIIKHVPDRWGSALDDFARTAIALADAEAGRL